jgi:hypothetical protein
MAASSTRMIAAREAGLNIAGTTKGELIAASA